MRFPGRDRCRIYRRRMLLPQKSRHCPARSQTQEASGAGCRSSVADRATQPTHHPNLEPSSASTDDHDALDRDDPAPITIEAEILSSPASHAAHDARAGRSPAKSRDQTPNHQSHPPATQPPAACKKRFCLLLSRLTKAGRQQARSAWRNAVSFEVEVELRKKGKSHRTRPRCTPHRGAKRS